MNIKVEGIEELQAKLKDNVRMDDVKRVVRHNGQQMTEKMIKNADFKRGYATGQTKRSITLEIEDGGMTARTGPETEYSPYVEYGTRFMDAQPFVRPAFNEQKEKFKSDMNKLMK